MKSFISKTYTQFSYAWFDLLRFLANGDAVAPRDQPTYERLGVSFTVDDARNNILVHPYRNLNYRFMLAEWLWIAAGRSDLESLTRYNKRMAQFSDDGETLTGAYGPRLANQWGYVLDALRRPDSRQAVASIWTPCPGPSKDIPCTLSLQFLSRGGFLSTIVIMRSSDIWLGLPHDFYVFSQLANGLAGELGLKPGHVTFHLGSSHLYRRDEPVAALVLANEDMLRGVASPTLPGRPPADDILSFNNSREWFANTAVWDKYNSALSCNTSLECLSEMEEM